MKWGVRALHRISTGRSMIVQYLTGGQCSVLFFTAKSEKLDGQRGDGKSIDMLHDLVLAYRKIV